MRRDKLGRQDFGGRQIGFKDRRGHRLDQRACFAICQRVKAASTRRPTKALRSQNFGIGIRQSARTIRSASSGLARLLASRPAIRSSASPARQRSLAASMPASANRMIVAWRPADPIQSCPRVAARASNRPDVSVFRFGRVVHTDGRAQIIFRFIDDWFDFTETRQILPRPWFG